MSNRDPREISRREAISRLGMSAAGLPLIGGLLPHERSQETQDKTQTKAARQRKLGVGYRPLGKTGLLVSEVVVGCGRIEASNSRIVEAALDQGINYIDTAPAYTGGRSEIAVGRILKARKGQRGKIVVSTKASGVNHGRLLEAKDEQVEKIMRDKLEKSLRALQTDHVEIYFATHGGQDPKAVDYPQMWKALEKFKKEGKIGAIALSTHANYKATSEAVIKCGKYDLLMTIINAPTMDPEVAKLAAQGGGGNQGGRRRRRRRRKVVAQDMRKIAADCKKHGIALVAMKAANKSFFPGETWNGGVDAYSSKADRKAYSDHQLLYRKVLGDDIAAVNIGMSQMSYLDEALAIEEALEKAKKSGKPTPEPTHKKKVRKG